MHLFRHNAPSDPQAALARVPILDIGDCLAGRPGALERFAQALRAACEDVGFFYLAGHGVPDALVEAAFEENRRFHALALERKQALTLDQNNIGYLGMQASIQGHSTVHRATRPNQNESFFVGFDRGADHPDVVRGVALRGRNQWPAGLPGFRERVMAYFDAMHGLAQRMLPAFSLALGMPAGWLDAYFEGENQVQLRLLHYPPTRVEDNDFGTGPHTDNSFLTILARNEVPGLAIRLPSGEWLEPPLVPGTFLVNIGNIMRRISNDRFLSTPHGVIVEGDRDRYSIAYFHSPHPYRTLEVAPAGVDAQHPAKYEPVLFADLILEFWNANYPHQKGYGKAAIRNRYS